MAWIRKDMYCFRGGYGLRYFFNAGLNRETLICDEEGTDIFDEDTLEWIGCISGVTPRELMDYDDEEFYTIIDENVKTYLGGKRWNELSEHDKGVVADLEM